MLDLKGELIAVGIAALLMLGAFGYGVFTGYKWNTNNTLKAQLQEVQRHAEVDKDVMHLDDVDLDRALQHWMR